MEPTAATAGALVKKHDASSPSAPLLQGEQGAASANAEERRTLTCPWCESPNVERVGAIGSHLMVSQYICLACHSPFEVIRR
jgi:hypothetical protein